SLYCCPHHWHLASLLFFCYCCGLLRDLHSFPTRRSSDLGVYASTRGGSTIQVMVVAEGLALLLAMPWFSWFALSGGMWTRGIIRSEEHTSELQSRRDLVCRLLLEKKKTKSRLYHDACPLP